MKVRKHSVVSENTAFAEGSSGGIKEILWPWNAHRTQEEKTFRQQTRKQRDFLTRLSFILGRCPLQSSFPPRSVKSSSPPVRLQSVLLPSAARSQRITRARASYWSAF